MSLHFLSLPGKNFGLTLVENATNWLRNRFLNVKVLFAHEKFNGQTIGSIAQKRYRQVVSCFLHFIFRKPNLSANPMQFKQRSRECENGLWANAGNLEVLYFKIVIFKKSVSERVCTDVCRTDSKLTKNFVAKTNFSPNIVELQLWNTARF